MKFAEVRFVTFALCTLAAVLIAAPPRAAAQAQQYPKEVLRFADTVLYNGKILTCDRDDTSFAIHEAVAVRDGKILAVGDSQAMLAMAGPDTKKIDLQGKTVVPGFLDSDSDNIFAFGDFGKTTQVGTHIITRGNQLEWTGGSADDMLKGNSIAGLTGEQAANNIRSIAAQAKPGETVYIRAPKTYPIEMKYWTTKELDKIVPSNPLAINIAGTMVLANSAMMKLAFEKGLPKDMFCVIKDSKEQPTGQLCQKAAGFVSTDIRPLPDLESLETMSNSLFKLLAELNRVGVTSLIGHASGLDFLIVNTLYHRNQLPMRFEMSMDLRTNPYIGPFLNRVGNLVDYSLGDMVKIVGGHVGPLDEGPNVPENILTDMPRKIIPEIPNVKGDPDGYGENQWAATTWTGKKWEDLTTKERMQTEWGTVMEARKLGWNLVGMHNMGSRAGRIFMETFEQAENQPGILSPRYRPLALDHNMNWSPASIDAASRLKDSVRFGLQDGIFQQREAKGKRGDVISAQWGELMNKMQPVKDLLARGVRIHLEGGDPWTRAPMKRIQEYVTRKDAQGRVWGLDQAVDRKTALLLSTRWVARFINEDSLGSIEPGKLADLVVLDKDLLTAPEDQIAKINVVMTLLGGKVVYEK